VDIHRGARITARDVEPLQIDLDRRPIRAVADPWPMCLARKPSAISMPVQPLNKNDVTAEPAVRAGREVTAHVVIGDARVTGDTRCRAKRPPQPGHPSAESRDTRGAARARY
jgi:flagella basal body P-ring formation protein FlgA